MSPSGKKQNSSGKTQINRKPSAAQSSTRAPGRANQPIPEPDPEADHEIEDILSHRGEDDDRQYLVRWKHYGPEDASWVKHDYVCCWYQNG